MVSLRFFTVSALLLAACSSAVAAPSPKPNDAKTTKYNLEITWSDYAPDGYTRQMLLVNGKSPGPVIKAKEGDEVVINVHNASPKNTSLHFHGTSCGFASFDAPENC